MEILRSFSSSNVKEEWNFIFRSISVDDDYPKAHPVLASVSPKLLGSIFEKRVSTQDGNVNCSPPSIILGLYYGNGD